MENDETQIVDPVRWHKLAMRRHEIEIAAVFGAMINNRIEPILIKGWAAARNYPQGHTRNFVDMDLAVSRDDFANAVALQKKADFPHSSVDLHNELRHYDVTAWNDLFARSKTIDVDGTPVRILCAEDHLRVLCAHWLNDGGSYKERLWDIYYAVDNRPDTFDWDLCLNSVTASRRTWILTAILIAHRHLGLNIEGIPFGENETSIPVWVENTLQHEWSSSDVGLRPLHTCLFEPSILFQQIRKRIPPNPIQATVEGDGRFDERSRLPIQLKNAFQRLGPALKRIKGVLFRAQG